MYVVVIDSPAARTGLAGTLRRITGGRAEKEGVGVWVLDKSEACELCEGGSKGDPNPGVGVTASTASWKTEGGSR